MEKDLSCQVTNWREYRRLQVKECGWSRQKPARRAAQRDEEAIRRWKEERWPQVKKKL